MIIKWNGNWLAYLIKETGRQKQQVAADAGMARATLSGFINGHRVPTMDALARIFAAMQMTEGQAQSALSELFKAVKND